MSSARLLERVLVADDCTDRAGVAIARTLSLPLEPGAELHVLHVTPASIREGQKARAAEEAAGTLERHAAAARERSPAGAPSISTHVVQGEPYVEIIRHARTIGADLVVVGRHRARRIRDTFVGSTAERIVRKGDVPVLLVACEATAPYDRALAAVDFGDTSRRVAELAALLCPEPGVVTLVHAYDVPFESTFERSVGHGVLEDIRRERREEVAAAGARLREALGPLVAGWQLVMREGDPRLVITREALRKRANLVVLGTHARSGVAHALLGSVAEWLIRAAPCDVAVTRPARFTFELP